MASASKAKKVEEEKARAVVSEFLGPYLEGSEDFEGEYSPGGGATFFVRKGEVALAAQTLLIRESSRRLERLTLWLIGLTGALLGLTAALAYLTARLSFH